MSFVYSYLYSTIIEYQINDQVNLDVFDTGYHNKEGNSHVIMNLFRDQFSIIIFLLLFAGYEAVNNTDEGNRNLKCIILRKVAPRAIYVLTIASLSVTTYLQFLL